MKIFGLRISREKKSRTFGAILRSTMGPAVWTPGDYEKLAKAGYERCMTAFACIKTIALAAGGVPWLVYKQQGGGKLEEVEDGDLVQLLKRSSWPRRVQDVVSYLNIAGNAYLERTGPNSGTPREVFCLRPDRMKVKPGARMGLVGGYEYKVGAADAVPLKAEEVLHLRHFHPTDDFYGLSPLSVAAQGVDIQTMAMEWNARLLQNDMRPPGAFISKVHLNDEDFEDLRSQIKELYEGYQNAGKPLLLEGEIDWKELMAKPKDMDWAASDQATTRRVCSVFGVPPECIGDAQAKTFANYHEARKALYVETVLPTLDMIRDSMNRWLGPVFGEQYYIDYDSDAIEAIQEARASKWTTVLSAVDRGVLNRNEARVEMGFDEVKGLELFTMPGSQIPVMIAGENILEE